MKNGKEPKTNYISAIAGLKVVSMLLMFWWHSDLEKPSVDLGARACEFFFLAAGFLSFYSHREHVSTCTIHSIYNYAGRKISAIWPIHFITFLLTLTYIKPNVWLSKNGLLTAALNLTMTHAYINDPTVYHSFNGVSWFCSAIMLCYIIAPFMGQILYSLRKELPLFLGAFLIRFFVEWLQTARPNTYWSINVHVYPPVRVLEFVMGMACAALYIQMRDKYKMHFWTASALEILAVLGTVGVMVSKQNRWLRAEFLLPLSILIYIFAHDSGVVSQIFKIRFFRFLASLQLPFFLLHQVIFRMIQHYYPTLYAYPKREFLVCLVLTVILSWIYTFFIAKKASTFIQGILNVR